MAKPNLIADEQPSSLRACCQALSGATFPQIFSSQIERVLRHLLEDDVGKITGPESIVAAFRSNGLIPPSLIESLKPYPQPEAQAVCFAACIFPTRSHSLEQEQLRQRLAAFQEALRSHDIYDFLGMHRLGNMPREEIERLLSDLSAADFSGKEQIREQRKRGAALFVAACTPEDIETIVRNWRDDQDLVRYIRNVLNSCPSDTPGAEVEVVQSEKLDWGTCGERDRAMALERHVRRKIRCLRIYDLTNALISQAVADCWQEHFDKLTSGFPYYAFRSHYARWWRVCVERWIRNHFLRGSSAGVEYLGAEEAEPPDSDLTPEKLRLYREGYRLVRSTFFHLTDPSQNEAVRQAVDDLWYCRLERIISAEAEPEMVKKIAERHRERGITAAQVNNYSHRLRLKMWAYTLARQERRSNQEILDAERPTKKGITEYPFWEETNQAGVLTIACLARTAHEDHTMLWPFTAHRILHPLIDRQHKESRDSWDLTSYLPEVWQWITAGSLEVVPEGGPKDWNRVEREAVSALQGQPLKALLVQLARLESEKEVRSFAAGDGRESVAEAERACRDCCLRLAQSSALLQSIAGQMGNLRQIGEFHWFVSVWYLAIMEQLGPDEVIKRLCVERCDRKKVLKWFSLVLEQ